MLKLKNTYHIKPERKIMRLLTLIDQLMCSTDKFQVVGLGELMSDPSTK